MISREKRSGGFSIVHATVVMVSLMMLVGVLVGGILLVKSVVVGLDELASKARASRDAYVACMGSKAGQDIEEWRAEAVCKAVAGQATAYPGEVKVSR